MASLDVGTLFSSYEELKDRIDEYQSQNSLNLSVRGSKSIEATRKRLPTRNLNEALKYFEISFACSDCVKNKTWNRSVNNVEVDCVNIRVVATKDGQHLEIRRINEKHNHPVAGEVKQTIMKPSTPSPSKRKRTNNNLNQSNSLPDNIIIDLGRQTERWQSLKEYLNVHSDEEFAEVLLNHLEQNFEVVQSSREVKPISTIATAISTPPIGKREEGAVQGNNHASGQQKKEFFSDLPENHKYKHSPVSGQQDREYFSDLHEINYENHEFKHCPFPDQQREYFSDLHEKHSSIPVMLPPNKMEPEVIYISEQEDESSPLQSEIKPLHEWNNEIYHGSRERSEIALSIIDLGKQYERWQNLKQKLQIDTDEGMAMFLIDW